MIRTDPAGLAASLDLRGPGWLPPRSPHRSSTATAPGRNNITNANGEFLWEQVEHFLDYLDEVFALHLSPSRINRGALTPSSPRLPRHHPHLLSRRLRLPLRLLPRLALAAGGHRHQLTDQEGLGRSILDVFCSCPMVRLSTPWQTRAFPIPGEKNARMNATRRKANQAVSSNQ